MFQQFQADNKFQHLCFEKTAPNFAQSHHDQSFSSEIQAEKEYVQKLKIQREKIEGLYSKYDVLLKELKSKQTQIKDKDRLIIGLETKCKNLTLVSQESSLFKQQNSSIKSQNNTLQKAISELEESYNYLHGQFRTKEAVTQQKYEQMQILNDDLICKVRSLGKRLLQREQQLSEKSKQWAFRWEQSKLQWKKEKQNSLHEAECLKQVLLQRQEENKLLRMDNTCLQERIIQLQAYINQTTFDYQQKMETLQKERKVQIRSLKNQMDNLRENNLILQKKWAKSKQEHQLKELSLNELSFALEKQQKQFNQILSRVRKEFMDQRAILKEQLVQCQNHILKMQRKVLQSQRKQQCLFGQIKRYQVCLDAKRNLRQIQKQELDKINMLLSLS